MRIKLQGPAVGSSLGTVAVTSDGNTQSAQIPVFGQTLPSALPLITGPQADGDTASVDTSRLNNLTSIQWRVAGGSDLGASPTQDLTGLGGSRIEVVTQSDEGVLTSPTMLVHTRMAASMPEMAAHDADDAALMALARHSDCKLVAAQSGAWSAPSTWVGGAIPIAGDSVLIPHGVEVIYDVDAGDTLIPQLRVDGTLRWSTTQTTHLYVRDFIGDRMSSIFIGNSLTDRIPVFVQAAITFEGQTPLDLTTDPKLMSRGLITLGGMYVYGAEKLNHARAAFGEPAGSTSIVLEKEPVGWTVGDQIIVGATALVLPEGLGAGIDDVSEDEIVTITALSGNTVSFTPALAHPHINQNPDSTRVDVRPMVQLRAQSRNVILTSELLAPADRRGHWMVMHHHSRTDIWDVGVIGLGRTVKDVPTGGIDPNGDFQFHDNVAIMTAPLTATSNVRGRYSFHTHKVGYDHAANGRPQPSIVNMTVEENPVFGITHHDCEMDIRSSSVFRFSGCGVVAEQGGELGVWDDLSVMQSTAKNRDLSSLHSSPKGQHGTAGVAGDFFRDGYGFGYRGRAITATRCVATTCSHGHVFWHRAFGDNALQLFDNSDPPRARTDLKEAGSFASQLDTNYSAWRGASYPIIHFADCGAIACISGAFVSKQSPSQQHDHNVIWKRFFSYGYRQAGLLIEYVGTYILEDTDVVAGPRTNEFTVGQQGIDIGNNCYQIAVIRPRTEGNHNNGIRISGATAQVLAGQTPDKDVFDAATDPRFWIVGHDSILDGNPMTYTNTGTKTLEQIAFIADDLAIDYDLAPTEDFPDIVGQWGGIAADPAITLAPDNATGRKMDNTGMPLPLAPKTWLDIIFPLGGPIQMGNLVNEFGTSQFNGQDVLVQREIISDVLTGRPAKFTALWQADNPVDFAAQNGAIVLADPVSVGDVLLTCAPGGSVSFNALAGATGGTGNYEIDPGDFTAPDYGDLTMDHATGEVVFTARPGVEHAADRAYIHVRSVNDTGPVKTETRTYGTIRIGVLITPDAALAAPVLGTHFSFAPSVAASAFEVNLLQCPQCGGRNVLRVEYSTDAGATWARLCNGFPLTPIRVSQASDGTTLTPGTATVRLRCQTDHEYAAGPETPDMTVVVGEPVTLIFGQSNAGFLSNTGSMQSEIAALGGDTTQLASFLGASSATLPDGPWNILTGDGFDAPGAAYTDMITKTTNHLANHPHAYIASGVWVHGETDSGFVDTRDNYVAAVTAVFAGARAAAGQDFPISATGVSSLQSLLPGGVTSINASMQQLAAQIPDVYYVDLEAVIAANGFVAGDVLQDALHWNPFFRDYIASAVLAEANIRDRYGLI